MQRSEFTNINKKIGNKVKRDGNFCSVVRFLVTRLFFAGIGVGAWVR